MRFGSFGREDNVLVTTFKSGGFDFRILPRNVSPLLPPVLSSRCDAHSLFIHASRQANLVGRGSTGGPPKEQDEPLQIPKKTKLYLEQTQREREFSVGEWRGVGSPTSVCVCVCVCLTCTVVRQICTVCSSAICASSACPPHGHLSRSSRTAGPWPRALAPIFG